MLQCVGVSWYSVKLHFIMGTRIECERAPLIQCKRPLTDTAPAEHGHSDDDGEAGAPSVKEQATDAIGPAQPRRVEAGWWGIRW